MEDSQVIKSMFMATAVSKVGNQSPYIQIAIGAGGGFVTGFALLKAFKALAIVLGGTILTIELAVQSGILTIKWNTIYLQLDLEDGEDDSAPRQRPDPRALPVDPFRKLKNSLLSSARFSVAFVGGFLLGMGFS